MATIRFEITITNDQGHVLDRFPSTTRVYANRIAKVRAAEMNGIASVKAIKPVAYNPADWQ